eukprot:CAMPEP_0179007416 /NCGR_PEP_ID=MMETSP0795-20121207/15149_1 /TAXON_ID=88552 /ORGANISM="Amoebophrya sp., Strain Ameob2" /LENGTH=992 /DNA_ID=CAMNT_0020702389 /DNA_START=131 /DNA_END=3109 /DNA_ORIENTATION=+
MVNRQERKLQRRLEIKNGLQPLSSNDYSEPNSSSTAMLLGDLGDDVDEYAEMESAGPELYPLPSLLKSTNQDQPHQTPPRHGSDGSMKKPSTSKSVEMKSWSKKRSSFGGDHYTMEQVGECCDSAGTRNGGGRSDVCHRMFQHNRFQSTAKSLLLDFVEDNETAERTLDELFKLHQEHEQSGSPWDDVVALTGFTIMRDQTLDPQRCDRLLSLLVNYYLRSTTTLTPFLKQGQKATSTSRTNKTAAAGTIFELALEKLMSRWEDMALDFPLFPNLLQKALYRFKEEAGLPLAVVRRLPQKFIQDVEADEERVAELTAAKKLYKKVIFDADKMVATCAVSASAKEKFVREALLKQQDVAFPLELVKLSVAFYLGRASSDTTTNCNSSSAQTDESTRLKRTTSSSAPPSDAALCQGFLQLLVDTGCITKKDVFFGLLRTLGTTDELSLDCGPLKVERFLRELLCGLVQREWEYNDSTNMTQELSAAEAGEAGGGDDSAETAGKVVQRGEHFQLPEELKKCRILHVPGGAQAQEILSAVEADLPECFVPVFLDLDAELEKELQEHVWTLLPHEEDSFAEAESEEENVEQTKRRAQQESGLLDGSRADSRITTSTSCSGEQLNNQTRPSATMKKHATFSGKQEHEEKCNKQTLSKDEKNRHLMQFARFTSIALPLTDASAFVRKIVLQTCTTAFVSRGGRGRRGSSSSEDTKDNKKQFDRLRARSESSSQTKQAQASSSNLTESTTDYGTTIRWSSTDDTNNASGRSVLRSRTRTLSSLSGEEPGRCAPTEESRGASPCSDFVHVSEEDATFLTSSPSTIASQETKKHVDEEEGQLQPHSERTKLKGVEMVDDGRKMLSQEQEDSPSPRPPSSADEVKNTHSKVDDDNSHSRKITSIAADLLEFLVQVVQEVPAEAVTPGFTDALDELKKSGDRVGFNKGVRLAGMCEKLFGEGQGSAAFADPFLDQRVFGAGAVLVVSRKIKVAAYQVRQTQKAS